MKNLKQTAYKLQTALNRQGVPVIIHEKRYFSIKYQRPMTKYKVQIRWPDRYAETLADTYSVAEVIKALAGKLEAMQEAQTP